MSARGRRGNQSEGGASCTAWGNICLFSGDITTLQEVLRCCPSQPSGGRWRTERRRRQGRLRRASGASDGATSSMTDEPICLLLGALLLFRSKALNPVADSSWGSWERSQRRQQPPARSVAPFPPRGANLNQLGANKLAAWAANEDLYGVALLKRLSKPR